MPAPRRTASLAMLTAGLLVLGAAVCKGAGESSSANADKKITVYSGRSDSLVKPLLEKFTQQTGIAVQVRYAGTAALATQLLEEGAKSPADVFFSQDAGALGAVAKKGLLAPLGDEVAAKVPATYRAKTREWDGVSARARVLAYNPDLVPQAQLPRPYST